MYNRHGHSTEASRWPSAGCLIWLAGGFFWEIFGMKCSCCGRRQKFSVILFNIIRRFRSRYIKIKFFNTTVWFFPFWWKNDYFHAVGTGLRCLSWVHRNKD